MAGDQADNCNISPSLDALVILIEGYEKYRAALQQAANLQNSTAAELSSNHSAANIDLKSLWRINGQLYHILKDMTFAQMARKGTEPEEGDAEMQLLKKLTKTRG